MSPHAEFQVTCEEDRLSRPVVVGAGVGVLVFIVVCTVVALRLTRAFATGAPPPAPLPARAEIGWVEQTPIRETQRGLDTVDEQRRSLQHWGWVDRSRGVARIPIDRAIDLVVADGGT
jgi:hypothetical protein